VPTGEAVAGCASAGRCSLIADFGAPSSKLIVEVVGGYHARRRAADASRDRKLARLGHRVVRLDAELVLRDLSAAVALVGAAL
jgi:very-short-patch-repair endonuclease